MKTNVLWCHSLFRILVAVIIAAAKSNHSKAEDTAITRIAFGSCSNQSAPQPMWKAIIDFNPQIFVWLGDNIYGDVRRPSKFFGKERTIGPWKNAPRFTPSSEKEMKHKYKLAKINPGYSQLRKAAKVIGTWDDHDFGLNDAGKEFPGKATNQRLLLDFLDEPQGSMRRKQEGVYTSYTFGPLGKQVKVILLDTRYHRDAVGSNGEVLGSSQWTWLEKELHSNNSAITIIGSSIQVISNLTAMTEPLFSFEAWGRFPSERNRLLKLIADSKRQGVFFISGDVHFGEISRDDCAIGYPLYDVTSSGLTQAVEKAVPWPLHLIVRFMAWWTPTTMRVMHKNCRFRSCTYARPNFGAIEINWNTSPVTLTLEVRDVDGQAVAGVKLPLTDLRLRSTDSAVSRVPQRGYRRHCTLEIDRPWVVRHKLASLFYGAIAVLLFAILGIVFMFIYAPISLMRRYVFKCKRD